MTSDNKLVDLILSKLDKMDEKLDSLAVDVTEQRIAFKNHLEQDTKMYLDIKPIIEEYKFDKEVKARRKKKLATVGSVLAVISTAAGLFALIGSKIL